MEYDNYDEAAIRRERKRRSQLKKKKRQQALRRKIIIAASLVLAAVLAVVIVNVTSGLKENGAIVINTIQDNDTLKKALKNYKGSIYKIDAKKISMEALGRYFPNTPMLAAIVKVSQVMSEEEFLADMIGSFKHKFAKKPEVIDGNMKALEMALREIEKVQ